MRAVQARVAPVDFLWKYDDVAIIGFGDERKPFNVNEIRSPRERDAHPASRVGAIGDQILAVDRRDAWIFDSKLLVLGEGTLFFRNEKWLRIGGEVKTVVASRQADD